MTYVNFHEDALGNTHDVDYYCSAECYTEHTGQRADSARWPGGDETDYDVYCANPDCTMLLWEGIDYDS